jgi:hypothetical protein
VAQNDPNNGSLIFSSLSLKIGCLQMILDKNTKKHDSGVGGGSLFLTC